jgi:DNA-binding LacI/PurR family transcriptional regulator
VHGRRRIVLLQGPPDHEDAHWRQLGYREALAAHGLPFDPALVRPGDFDRHVAQASVARLLESGVAFDAILTGDDEAAVGARQALRAAGKPVPEEVAVVGFDDQRLAAVLDPPLTTVHAPTEEVGRFAAQHLIHLIRTSEARPLTLLPTQIVVRRSCGCDG